MMFTFKSASVALVAIASLPHTLGGIVPSNERRDELFQTRTPPSTGGDPFTDKFGEYTKSAMEEWKIVGMSIGVIDGDKVFTKGYGFAELPDVPATPETLWYSASTTKAQLAAITAQLIDNGAYPALAKGWSTSISSVIRDDFVMQDDWSTDHLTLNDAVSHRTGLGDHDGSLSHKINGKNATVRDLVRNIRNLQAASPPRTDFIYCNYMYTVITHVVETVTGKPLRDLFKSMLWDPLGMKSTYYGLQEALDSKKQVARGYYFNNHTQKYAQMPLLYLNEVGGAGALMSNVVDYTKWVKCLLQQTAPFSKAVHRDIQTPRNLDAAQPQLGMDVSLYGLGWWRTTIRGNVVYRHSGAIPSHVALVYWLPDINYGIVMFANSPTAATEMIARKMVDDKLAAPAADRFDMDKALKDYSKYAQQVIDNAPAMLYPNSPTPPLPSKFNATALAGKYRNDGYGTLTIKVSDDKNSLVIDRPEMSFSYRWVFRHVSQEYWVSYLYSIGGSPDPTAVNGAVEFKIDADGDPSDFIMTLPGPAQTKVTFERL